MKVVLKILTVLGIILLIVVALVVILLIKASLTPFAPNNYTKTVETGGTIEAKYLAMGEHEVKYLEQEVDTVSVKYQVYYPEELAGSQEKYPAVVFVNGTGVYASKYKALFKHLASWGFIVLGNEDPSTWSGVSADETLAWLLAENEDPDSIFYQKVDVDNIGITGHSQGGVGVFSAITTNEHSGLYKTAVPLSPTGEESAAALNMPYDVSKVTIPIFMLAGAGDEFETKLVIPFEQMTAMYEKLDVPKAMARRTNAGHGQMLYSADGYVTAWLMWHLQGDVEAAKAFTGESPELMSNELYQDQRFDLKNPNT